MYEPKYQVPRQKYVGLSKYSRCEVHYRW